MGDKVFCCYQFGEFRLDERRRTLSKNGSRIPLSARNFDLLLFMVENGGRILEHDEILDKVWEGTFVEQSSLKKGISALRHILEESFESEFIKTVPRRGYSFVAPVSVIHEKNEILFLRETEQEILVEEIEDDEIGETTKFLPPPSSEQDKNFLDKIKKYRIPAIAVSIFLVVLIGYTAWKWVGKKPRRISVENITITRLTNKGNLGGTVISPSGAYLLYVTVEDDGSSLWLQQTSTGSATKLISKMQGKVWNRIFSPDENYAYYTVDEHPNPAQNGLFKVPLLGGVSQKVAENIGFPVDISPDGRHFVFARLKDTGFFVYISDPDGNNEKLIVSLEGEFRIWGATWSPDSKSILLAIRKFTADKIVHYVAEYPIDGSREKIVVPEMDKQITSAVWLPDKSSLLVCLREVNAEVRQIWQYFPESGEFSRVTNDDNSYKHLSLTRDGKTIATVTENRYSAVWTADNGKFDFQQITKGVNRIDKVQWTADGRLVYSGTENGIDTISVMNEDGSQARRITSGNDGTWLLPKVSGDGSSLTYSASRNGKKRLLRIDFDGRNSTQLTPADFSIYDGKLLSDNRTVVFLGNSKTNKLGLYKQTAEGMLTPLTDEEIDEWDISPDERFVAYKVVDSQSKKSRVLVKFMESGWPFKNFDINPVWYLCWTKDGKALTYSIQNNETSESYLQPIDGGEPKLIAKFPAEQTFSLDWSFDGKKLAVVRGKQLTDAVSIKIADDQ